jgi:hypothetical protein
MERSIFDSEWLPNFADVSNIHGQIYILESSRPNFVVLANTGTLFCTFCGRFRKVRVGRPIAEYQESGLPTKIDSVTTEWIP